MNSHASFNTPDQTGQADARELSENPQCQRVHERKRMFVTASFSSDAMTGTARIRNMSDMGALIEADALPEIGKAITVRRGDLRASGKIVRRDGRKAGVRFDRAINVYDWLPNKAGSQLMVDTAFETIKPRFEGGPPQSIVRAQASALPSSPSSVQELESIADMLDRLADSLSEDPVIIASYLDRLQVLDIASQKLRKAGRELARR